MNPVSRPFFQGQPFYVFLGVLYLWISDLWLLYLLVPSRLPAIAVFLFFFCTYLASKDRTTDLFKFYMGFFHWCILFVLFVSVQHVFTLGYTHREVIIRFSFVLSFLIVGFALARPLGLKKLVYLMAIPYVIQGALSLPFILKGAAIGQRIADVYYSEMLSSNAAAFRELSLFKWGVGSYTLYAAMALLLALLASYVIYEPKRPIRLALYASILVMAGCILTCFYRNPVIIAIFGLTVLLLRGGRKAILFCVVAVVMVCGVLLFADSINESFKEATIGLGSNLFKYGLVEGDPSGRINRALISWETFLDHPILGVGPYEFYVTIEDMHMIGGHSTIADWPAQYGVFGIIFVCVVFHEIIIAIRVMQRNNKPAAALALKAFLVSTIVAATINPLFLKADLDKLFFPIVGACVYYNHARRGKRAHWLRPANSVL